MASVLPDLLEQSAAPDPPPLPEPKPEADLELDPRVEEAAAPGRVELEDTFILPEPIESLDHQILEDTPPPKIKKKLKLKKKLLKSKVRKRVFNFFCNFLPTVASISPNLNPNV